MLLLGGYYKEKNIFFYIRFLSFSFPAVFYKFENFFVQAFL